MPDQLSQNFEHKALEADIKVLAAEIRKHIERPETKNMGGEEILKQAIRSFPVSAPTPKVPVAQTNASPLPEYAQSAPAEVKLEIEYLLDMAFHHGLAKADALARKSPPFVLDAFHDALAGKLYPEFQRRGILK
jgi:hypothetical protein